MRGATKRWRVALLGMVALLLALALPLWAAGPKTGDAAPAVASVDLEDKPVSLADLVKESPVAVVFLRGNPGYQCPICTRQVASFMGAAAKFKAAGARVLFVYPGPTDGLKEHAADFVRGKSLPDHFDLVIDPDYAATNAWGLRWKGEGETAYPSTFVVDKGNVIRFAKVSTTHDGRSTADEVIAAIEKLDDTK